MDWNKEVENLRTGSDLPEFLKLKAGQHKVEFQNDGIERTQVWEEKEIPKVDFKVRVNGQEFTWSVTKGITVNSLYGQIALVAKNNTSLIGKTVTVIVKGSGKETSYTILEALALMEQEEKNRKPVEVVKIGA